jgi:transcriptional regulator with XRE-family HTH domain
MENTTLAERIQARLEALGKSASSVALEGGLSRSAVLDILRGKAASPRLDTLQKLTGPLECSLDYLAGASDEPGASPDHERMYALLDTSVTSPAISLEAGVFREGKFTPAARDDAVLYRDPRQPGWTADLYLIGDESLAGLGIRKGDIATVLEPSTEEGFPFKNGLVVAIRREISEPKAYEHSARVVEISGDKVHLVTRPASGTPNILTVNMAEDQLGDDFPMLGSYFLLEGGGTVEVLGVVARVTRSLPI